MATAWERDCKNFRKNQKRRSGPLDVVIALLQIAQMGQSFYMFIVCGQVIVVQGNILDVFMNFAALLVVIEFDDWVG